ncbi:DUF1127 domain-containing protein [Pseudomonas sp. N040]|uniref:DUF1127 domain-containing protein n=1 Tax=Pseudomonas sp. N040 TaxID=2785325 RepID=UPI0018A2BC72|nr:DUF1127 domain-containing protein [Pseudomonas sp. N040]MBF7729241.1 DUF1127 domain-containing protein [Pseudomonas sp. N040]MBW7012881.1 DUF1127 domain-containing protein [Pseudomonas sp. N040]
MKDQSASFAFTSGGRRIVQFWAPLRAAYRQLRRWWQLSEQRRRLALLDERALHDIGLSRADAMQESERPFWDDPLAK